MNIYKFLIYNIYRHLFLSLFYCNNFIAEVPAIGEQSLLREASQIDFVHEKRHMDALLKTPPPLETSRTFFDFVEAPGAFY